MYNFDLRHKNIYKNGSQIWVRNQSKSHTILASSMVKKMLRQTDINTRLGVVTEYNIDLIKIY